MKQFYLILALVFSLSLKSQYYTQYFDGNDTSSSNSIFLEMDTSSTNTWQIGKPQKTIFNAASTLPNVLITDTTHPYPKNDSSSFSFKIPDLLVNTRSRIIAIQWNQKLDFDANRDGGIIEYRLLDSIPSPWLPVFSSPYLYNFYGFHQDNYDTLPDGQFSFTGQDTTWKNIWVCFDGSWFQTHQGMELRFSILSDSIDNQREGWMIDNLVVSPTFVHTLVENPQENYVEISPNPSRGQFTIHLAKQRGHHLIEELSIVNSQGELIRHLKDIPTKFSFDISDQPAGNYFLKVKTNLSSETVKIILYD